MSQVIRMLVRMEQWSQRSTAIRLDTLGEFLYHYDPLDHLDHMGVRVAYGGRAMKHSGIYVHEARVVVLRTGMSARLERCVLTHEAVHAEHGDVPHWDGDHHAMIELRTDIIAAHRLIGHREWRRYGHLSVPEVCDALAVVPRVVETYRTYGAGLDAWPQGVGAR